VKSTRFQYTLELWKGTKIYSVGKRIPTVYYSLSKEIGTYAICGLALEEFYLPPSLCHTLCRVCQKTSHFGQKRTEKEKEKEYGVFWDTVYMWLRLCVAVYVPPSMSRCVIHCVSKNVSVKNEPRKKKRKTEVFSEAQCTCGWHCV